MCHLKKVASQPPMGYLGNKANLTPSHLGQAATGTR